MHVAEVMNLPIGGEGCGDVKLSFDGLNVILEFEYNEAHQPFVGHLEFLCSSAFRFRNEMHARGFVSESYDVVVRIEPSEWKTELLRIEPTKSLLSSIKSRHHFAVMLSSNGYFEVIAEAFGGFSSRPGRLSP
jgi:hypothetical protein